MNYNNDNKYDFEKDPLLISGKRIEKLYHDYITNRSITYEIKSDKRWVTTGNIYIEIEQRLNNKWVPSGILVTKSDIFVYILLDKDENIVYSIEMPTKKWLKRIDKLKELGLIDIIKKEAEPKCPATIGYRIPIKYIYITDIEIETEKEKIKQERIKLANEKYKQLYGNN